MIINEVAMKPPSEVWFFCTPNGDPVGYSFYGPQSWEGAHNGVAHRYVLADAKPAPKRKAKRKRSK